MSSVIQVSKTGHAWPQKVVLPASAACHYRVTATRDRNVSVRFYKNRAVAEREARVLARIADEVTFTTGYFNVIPDLIYG